MGIVGTLRPKVYRCSYFFFMCQVYFTNRAVSKINEECVQTGGNSGFSFKSYNLLTLLLNLFLKGHGILSICHYIAKNKTGVKEIVRVKMLTLYITDPVLFLAPLMFLLACQEWSLSTVKNQQCLPQDAMQQIKIRTKTMNHDNNIHHLS